MPETFVSQSLMAASNKNSKKCKFIYRDTTILHCLKEP
uniref:Uncharacterized protein n=1 Tax=Arundo donax TaxID=35708 RepID=A0A0A9H5F2_ARUDO